MKKLADAIIQPSIIAVGCGIFLYAYNQNLRNVDYFLHLPFWIGIVRPTGIWWHTKFLKQINKGIFPPEMKVYRQMYLVSKNAILYDIVLNHLLYSSLLAPSLIAYMYFANNMIKGTKVDIRNDTAAQNKSQTNSLGFILKNSALNLIQGRVMISCLSILSQYWISYVSIRRLGQKKSISIPSNTKKLLLLKQMMLNWSWWGLVLNEFYKYYWGQDRNKIINKLEKEQL